jgi:hypothetical protein
MAGLVPAIYVLFICGFKTWMPATSAGMTITINFLSDGCFVMMMFTPCR